MKNVIVYIVFIISAPSIMTQGAVGLNQNERREIVEIMVLRKQNLIVALLDDTEGRRVVVTDPFRKVTVSKKAGDNFVALSNLISPKETWMILPTGSSSPLEVYYIDNTLIEKIDKSVPAWRFQVVTKKLGSSVVQNYGGWLTDQSCGFGIEYGSFKEEAQYNLQTHVMTSKAELTVKEFSSKVDEKTD